MSEENWLEIKNTSYFISDCGRVKNRRDKILKPIIVSKRYYGVQLFDGRGNYKCFRIHRLVADAFLPEPEQNKNSLFVNHKDLNKLNNHASNLEWMTCRENTLHGYKLKKQFDEMERLQILREKELQFVKQGGKIYSKAKK